MSKKTLTISIISIIILALIGGGAVWYVKTQKQEPNNMPVTENNNLEEEQESNELQEETSSEADMVDNAESSLNLDQTNWLNYRNDEYGYELKYPKSWSVEENNKEDAFVKGRIIKNVIFYNPNKAYSLLFGTKKESEDIYIEGRTGFPAQDTIEKGGEISINNVKVNILYSIYKNRVNEIYYSKLNSQKKPYEYFELNDNLLGHATFSNYDDSDLKYSNETKIGDKILESFRFID